MRLSSVVRPRGTRDRVAWRVAPVFRSIGIAVLLGLPFSSGCTSEGMSGVGGNGAPVAGDSVSFDDKGTLELSPSELRMVAVTTTPGATVSFLIIGESYDASLDQGTVVADASGNATVTLRAPSKPSTFHLLATTGKAASAELPVSVSSLGFASIQVTPKYVGARKVTGWSATVAVGSSCDTVLSNFPKDPPGALKATAASDKKPLVASVPVGPTLAIAVRSGALMWGCVETQLSAPDTVDEIGIAVINRPMVLQTASLTLGLEFVPAAPSYSALLDDGANLITLSAFPQGPVAGDLLDAMHALVPIADQSSFDSHRQGTGLDTAVAQAMAADPRQIISGWLSSVKTAVPLPTPPQITGVLKGTTDMTGMATFDVTALGPVPAMAAGVSPTSVLSWTANADDTLVIGGHFSYSPTRYVGALLSVEAVNGTPGATDAATALAIGIDCATIGPLVEGYAGCTSGCGQPLCEQALSSMWQRGIAAADSLGLVDVAASGSAQVDDAAEPLSLDGNWVGDMTAFGSTCVVKGAAKGEAAVPPS